MVACIVHDKLATYKIIRSFVMLTFYTIRRTHIVLQAYIACPLSYFIVRMTLACVYKMRHPATQTIIFVKQYYIESIALTYQYTVSSIHDCSRNVVFDSSCSHGCCVVFWISFNFSSPSTLSWYTQLQMIYIANNYPHVPLSFPQLL